MKKAVVLNVILFIELRPQGRYKERHGPGNDTQTLISYLVYSNLI